MAFAGPSQMLATPAIAKSKSVKLCNHYNITQKFRLEGLLDLEGWLAFTSPPQPKAARTAVAKTHQYGLEGKVASLDQTEY